MELGNDPLAMPEAKISTNIGPWSVITIYKFQFYCCPECDKRCEQKKNFIDHVYSHHPIAFKHLSAIDDGSLSGINLPWSDDNIKLEVEDKSSQSLWSVKSIYEFQLYCCPECNTGCQHKQTFINHAYYNHCEAFEVMSSIQDQSLSDINVPWSVDIKNEKEDECYDQNEYLSDQEEFATDEPQPKKAKRRPRRVLDPTMGKNPNSEVQCYFCSQMVTLANILSHIEDKHVIFHSTSKMYGPPRSIQCRVCNAAFETQSTMDWHMCYFDNMKTLVRNTNGKYQCSVCSMETRDFPGLRRHILCLHRTERPFQCEQCVFKTKTSPQLTKHVQIVHDKKTTLKSGVKEEDSEMVQCYYCSQMVPLATIEPHITAEHGTFLRKMYGPPRRLQCHVCKGAFGTQSNLDWHTCYLHHLKPVRNANGNYQCSDCTQEWTDGPSFRRHFIDQHTTEKPFECESCDFKTKMAHRLTLHFKRVHLGKVVHDNQTEQKSAKVEEVQCYYCSEMVIVANIHPHITSKHGTFNTKMYGPPRHFHCQVCKGAFDSPSNLAWHICYLHNLKPVRNANAMYQCSVCGKEWKAGSTFRRHFLCVHTKEKPFHCEHCDFKTKIAPELTRHEKNMHDKTIQQKSELTMMMPKRVKEEEEEEEEDSLDSEALEPESFEGVYIVAEENKPNSAETLNDFMEDEEILRNDNYQKFKEPKEEEQQPKTEVQVSKVVSEEENKPFLEWLSRIVKK
jgi:hypothetical protein